MRRDSIPERLSVQNVWCAVRLSLFDKALICRSAQVSQSVSLVILFGTPRFPNLVSLSLSADYLRQKQKQRAYELTFKHWFFSLVERVMGPTEIAKHTLLCNL